MAISKRAKARLRLMTASEKTAIKKSTKALYEAELMGIKRMREIIRWAEKRC